MNPTFYAVTGDGEVLGLAHVTLVQDIISSPGWTRPCVDVDGVWWPASVQLRALGWSVLEATIMSRAEVESRSALARLRKHYKTARGWLRLAREGKGDLDECLHHARKSRQWAREARNRYRELTSAGT